jgi:hypothetical protein
VREFPLGRYLYHTSNNQKSASWYPSTHSNFASSSFATREADAVKVAQVKKKPTEYFVVEDEKLDMTKAIMWWEMV